jgi:hypothetical protein
MAAGLDIVLERGVEAVAAGLATAALPATVYAVGLWGTGDEPLGPGVACIGLERDREAALTEQTPYEAFNRVWNVSDYGWDARPVPDLRFDPEFPAIEEEAREALRARGVWDPQRYLLNRIARRLGERPPPWPVTRLRGRLFRRGLRRRVARKPALLGGRRVRGETRAAWAPPGRHPGVAGLPVAARDNLDH